MSKSYKSGLPKGIKLKNSNALKGYRIESAKLYKARLTVRYDEANKAGVSDDTMSQSAEAIMKVIKFLRVPDTGLPVVDLTSTKALTAQPFTVGKCSLNQTITLNPLYFHPDTTYSDIKQVRSVIHEYAHALEAEFVKRTFSNLYDRRNAWDDCAFAEQIVNNAVIKIGGSTDNWRSYAGKISSYATHDHSECLAEAVAHYFTHAHTEGDFASAVVDELRKTYRQLVGIND